MKDGLGKTLREMIHARGFLSLDEIDTYCKSISTEKKRYKLSNAERRLRPSESPDIEGVERNGAIIGYKVREEKESYYSPPKPIKRTPHPFQVAAKVEEINQIPVFKERKVVVSSNSLGI